VIFRELELEGAYLIEPQRHEDDRGFFARTFCRRELAEQGIEFAVAQANLSSNRLPGTLRGMHYQTAPSEEAKIVRCARGAIHDVIVDIRPGSPTLGRHAVAELTADNRLALYVPPGFAHGFQSLAPDTDVFYLMSAFYAPEHAAGFRYDDPEVGIRWPLKVATVSEKDRELPPFRERAR